jgi:hypothetical protein
MTMHKKNQTKTRTSNIQATRIVHVAIPMPVFERIIRMAHDAERSINWMVRNLIEDAILQRRASRIKR